MSVTMNDYSTLPSNYVNALLGMNNEAKLHVIRLLTDSLLNDCAPTEDPDSYTQQMIKKHAGTWHGSESTEEIMECIRENYSNRQPLGF